MQRSDVDRRIVVIRNACVFDLGIVMRRRVMEGRAAMIWGFDSCNHPGKADDPSQELFQVRVSGG